jgi:hypothetical protein
MWGTSPSPLFWFDFSINFLMIIAIMGYARATGAEAQGKKSPQERLPDSLQDFYRAEIISGNYHRSSKGLIYSLFRIFEVSPIPFFSK